MPSSAANSTGYKTAAGDYNNIYRYTIGRLLPGGGWPFAPDLAINLGLPSIPEVTIDVAVEPQTGNIYGMVHRIDFAAPSLQVFDPTGKTRLFTSLADANVGFGPDPLEEFLRPQHFAGRPGFWDSISSGNVDQLHDDYERRAESGDADDDPQYASDDRRAGDLLGRGGQHLRGQFRAGIAARVFARLHESGGDGQRSDRDEWDVPVIAGGETGLYLHDAGGERRFWQRERDG